jgi:hypothetical protein
MHMGAWEHLCGTPSLDMALRAYSGHSEQQALLRDATRNERER